MFDDEALEEKSCFTNNGKIKYTLMTLIINWCIISYKLKQISR